MSDADFENSSFDSEDDFSESFKTPRPNTTFEQKEEIPDSMDWSVQQVHQYLSDRGLSKVATDKILENVNKFDKKKSMYFYFYNIYYLNFSQ